MKTFAGSLRQSTANAEHENETDDTSFPGLPGEMRSNPAKAFSSGWKLSILIVYETRKGE